MFKLRVFNNKTNGSFSNFLLLRVDTQIEKRCFVESRFGINSDERESVQHSNFDQETHMSSESRN